MPMELEYLKSKTGFNTLEYMGVIAVVAIAVAVAAHVLRPGENFLDILNGKSKIKALTKEAKNEAALVIVGKIASMQVESHEKTDQGDTAVIDHGIWKLKVESVERGDYPGSEITFSLGWRSNRVPPEEFPMGIKTRYYTGDRVRAFLAYGVPGRGQTKPCYFTRFAYFCLEPVDPEEEN
jgi:hypothetical protein